MLQDSLQQEERRSTSGWRLQGEERYIREIIVFFSSHKFSNYYRIESSLVPYQFDEDMKDGEGVLATEKEGDEEERHKYNYFSGGDPLHNFASLTRAVIVAISSVFLFQSLQ